MLEKEIRIKILKNYHESKADWLNKEFKKEIGGTNMSKEEGIRINLKEFYPEEEMIQALREMNQNKVEQLNESSRRLFYAVMYIADERDKYKNLYQNEKDKADTLRRIIKKIEEYCNSIIKESRDEYGNYLYYYPPYIDDILNLLKEMK